jgi:hypothetical protein
MQENHIAFHTIAVGGSLVHPNLVIFLAIEFVIWNRPDKPYELGFVYEGLTAIYYGIWSIIYTRKKHEERTIIIGPIGGRLIRSKNGHEGLLRVGVVSGAYRG